MLAITLGDPYSVNVEILIKEWKTLKEFNFPILLIGSHWQFDQQCKKLRANCYPEIVENIDALNQLSQKKSIFFWDVGGKEVDADQLSPKDRGEIAVRSLEMLRQIMSSKLSVITLPITKSACYEAGFDFPGQTEFFEALWKGKATMVLAGNRLRVGLVTNHHPLKEISQFIDKERVYHKTKIFLECLKDSFAYSSPRVAVCGLNPHCGEGGHMGDEELRYIAPAVRQLRSEDWRVSGPWSADTVFARTLAGEFDGVVAMYHDQGLGPLKTVDFDSAINISAGLKHQRVSPDHGPASDLFLAGKAKTTSLQRCLNSVNFFQTTDEHT